MIDKDFLAQLAVKTQTSLGNILREYYQRLFLESFYKLGGSGEFLFKGGTALHLVFNSPRFSEDLDFTARSEIKPFENLLISVLEELEKNGISVDLIEALPTSGGHLAKMIFKNYVLETSLSTNVSNRTSKEEGETVLIAGETFPSFNSQILRRDLLMGEKMTALLTRQKPRDFYDLYFLLRSGFLPLEKRQVLGEVLLRLKKTKINFEAELKQFLPKSHWSIIKDFKITLEKELERFLKQRPLLD